MCYGDKGIAVNKYGIYIDGKKSFLLTGEFPYYRMEPHKWASRLDLIKETGIRIITCYVPWNFHEYHDGKFDFEGKSDTARRNLKYFLKLLSDRGMYAICKPGPFICAEVKHGGIPDWLVQKHPEILTKDCFGEHVGFRQDGKPLPEYLHPVYLHYVERWYKVFCEEILKENSTPGGCIAMIQVENEIPYSTSELCNPYSWGYNECVFEIFSRWLQNKYLSIASYNKIHFTQLMGFDEIRPPVIRRDGESGNWLELQDWVACKEWYGAEILDVYKGFLQKAGNNLPVYHNLLMLENESPANYYEMAKKMWIGSNFWLLPCPNKSFDSYVTGQMRVKYLKGSQPDMPVYVPELNWGWGNATDFDFLSRFLLPDMEGFNIYTLVNADEAGLYNGIEPYTNEWTNFPSCAPIELDGTKSGTYNSLYDLAAFIGRFGESLTNCRNIAKLAIGYYVPYNHMGVYMKGNIKYKRPEKQIMEFVGDTGNMNGFAVNLIKKLVQANIDYRMIDIGNTAIGDGPGVLIIPAMYHMDMSTQVKILEYLKDGGDVLICGEFPQADLDGKPCNILESSLDASEKTDDEKYRLYTCGRGTLRMFSRGLQNNMAFEKYVEVLKDSYRIAYAEDEFIEVIPRYFDDEIFLYIINRGENEFRGNVFFKDKMSLNLNKLHITAAPTAVSIAVVKGGVLCAVMGNASSHAICSFNGYIVEFSGSISNYFYEQRHQSPTSTGGGFPIEKTVSGEIQSPTDVVQTPRESGARRHSLRELMPDSFRHKCLTKFEEELKHVFWSHQSGIVKITMPEIRLIEKIRIVCGDKEIQFSREGNFICFEYAPSDQPREYEILRGR